jgi:hypothetical protein
VGGDVMATLAELDDKLAALQREVHGGDPVGGDPEPTGPPADPTPPPAIVAAARPRAEPAATSTLAALTLPVGELAGWRERLRGAIAQLAALQAEIDAHIAAAGPLAAGGLPPEPRPIDPSSGAPVPTPHDRIFDGRVTVDAGPFLDVDDVSTFQRALEHVAGAAEVYVTGFELNRAVFELDLAGPVALGREIRAALPFNFAIFEAAHGRLAINVDAAAVPR